MKRIILGAGLVCVAGLGALGWRAMTPPPLPQMLAAVEGGPIVSIQVPASLPAEAQAGKQLFDASCASCHGADAVGQYGTAPPLIHVIYEPNHHGDASFQRAVAMGVQAHHWRFGDMPAVEGLTPGDVTQITAYVRALQQANGIK